MTEFIQYVIGGLAIGSVYGLVALGFVLVFKSTDVFNFAQGDLLVVGAYLMFTMVTTLSLPVVPALIIVVASAAILGVILQLVLFRPLIGRPLLTVVMVTIALSLVIRAVIVIIYGPQERTLEATLPSDSLAVLGLRISTLDLIVMGITAACVLAFAVFFRKTSLGLQMRATAENVEAAMLSGIDSNRVFLVAFAIGTATAALGGALMGNLQAVQPQLSALGLLAVPAAVIGGLTSIPGALVGGLIIGVVQQLSVGYISGQAANVGVYVILMIVLLLRPFGIFGKPTVERV
jgi:branched-chain amino acid transport system permease protein